MLPRNGSTDSQKNQYRRNGPHWKRKASFFVEFVFSARGRKLIHAVKELKDVGERNIQLEQTKQI